MASNLAKKGKINGSFIVYYRTVSCARQFQALNPNIVVAESAAEAAAKADIITCLGNGKLFVDCSTIHPYTTPAIANNFQDAGAQFVASPVFGAPAMAAAGQVICVLAGPRESVDKVKSSTTGVIAKSFVDFTDQQHAKASQLKILGNTFVLRMFKSIAEGHVLADKCELGTDALHQFFESVSPGPYVAYSTACSHTREEPLFAVGLARKDARHALDLAKRPGTAINGVEMADEYMGRVKKHMGELGDVAGIYGAVREVAGLNFEN
ncbi:unnamed protein product [Penicillium pancosmium]